MALFGWLVPGGVYLLKRRYQEFVLFAILISSTFAAGVALHGSWQWPGTADLTGIGGFDGLLMRAGAFTRALAGAPYLVARFFGMPPGFLAGRIQEYGTTLLTLAGLFNVLSVAGALEAIQPRAR